MKLAIGNSRMDKIWRNCEMTWDEFCERVSITIRTPETVAEYRTAKRGQQDRIKDVGGFVGGWLREGRRKNGNVLCRSMLTLDMDYALPDTWAQLREFVDFACCVYSTHKHTPEKSRLRLIIPLAREITEDEYPTVGRMVAKQIGIDLFDDTTYEASRLMYWPSTSRDGEFVFERCDGFELDPDAYLGMYQDWRDVSTWPVSKRQLEVERHAAREQSDPLSKDGIVGVFCRAYSIEDAIETFLPDVYEPSVMEGRYDYIPADSCAGVVVYDGKFAYSHHATDPANGKLLNAFDLVRIHRFRDMDDRAADNLPVNKLPSYQAMCEFAVSLNKVKIQIDEERRAEAAADFAGEDKDWRTLLKYQPKSHVLENSVWNEVLILQNDPEFANFAYNEFANRIQVTGATPWERPSDNRYWRDADTAQLKALLDVCYVSFSSRNHDVSFTKVADDRRFHPIRDYLNSLPQWDGVPRIETLLVRCLQADDNPYVRAVSRKTFAAAVARIYKPGTKFDSVLVFDGVQGIGKSTLFKEIVGDEYYSETLSLTDMDDKSGAEKLQGFWVVEIGELAGMKKADIEKVKAFLSTSDDKYRPSYGKTVESHPRQCIIIGSVNGERGYLRDITGNRRFWIVKVHQEEQVKKWSLSTQERDQIWAEAKAIYESGEKLYLEGDLIRIAESAQRDAMEVDERQGMVEEYLNTLLPEYWDTMDVYQRRNFISDRSAPTNPKGVTLRMEVSNAEIWSECLGRNISELKPADSYALAALMTKVSGWERTHEMKRLALYGRQRIYRRTCSNT